MKKLKGLGVEGNLLKRLRPAVVRKGTVAIMKWLRDQAPEQLEQEIEMDLK